MTDTNSKYPVMKGEQLSRVERSYDVLHEEGTSSLELKLTLGSSVRTFDQIIQNAREQNKNSSPQPLQSVATEKDLLWDRPDSLVDVPVVSQGSRTQMSTMQLRAVTYLERRKIFELFNFFIGHLLKANPKNPVEFILQLLDECMYFRAHCEGRLGPPLLFGTDHVRTVFRAFDAMRQGFITTQQYREAMKTLGINSYNEPPDVDATGRITEHEFIEEAKRCLSSNLRALIHVPNTS